MAKILVIEDDALISKNIKTWLENENHTVDIVDDGALGLDQLTHYPYDLAIIDWNLPGMDGASICRSARNNKIDLPLLMLTAKSSLSEKIVGLDSGAYDYLVKPCSLEELSARVRALLRRTVEHKEDQLSFGNISVSKMSREVQVNGQSLSLSPSEFDILLLLTKDIGVPTKTERLLAQLGKPDMSSQLIRVHITNLRKKLQNSGANHSLVGQKGAGYALYPEGSPESVNREQISD